MKLYVASTSSFAGKTLLALAIGKIWGEKGVRVGYVKPLGKIPVMEGGFWSTRTHPSWPGNSPWRGPRKRRAPW